MGLTVSWNKILLAAAVLSVADLHAQAVPAPAFEVASIKLNKAEDGMVMMSTPAGGKFSTIGSTVRMLLQNAYGVQNFQIAGGPAWLNTERYDIEARSGENASKEQVRLMIQTLLADRFQIKLHRETQQLPVYELVVGKNGSKLKEGKCVGTPSARNPCGGFSIDQRGELIAREAPVSQFAEKLSMLTGRTVFDKTGLAGNYDIDLKWTPDARILQGAGDPGLPPAALDRPSIFTAVQEQLGLKLESAKGPIEVLVIDRAARPSAN